MPSILLPVPHYKQIGAYNCLPACARMVLSYLGKNISETDLATQLGSTPLGTSGSRLLRLRDTKLDIFWGPLTLSLIYNNLNNKIPVIYLIRTIFLDYWESDMAHAVVVVGYNNNHLLLNDPDFSDAPQQATINGFLAAWGEFDFLCGIIQ